MYSLTVNEAIRLVRRNLDELMPNGSVMYTGDDNDNTSLDNIIKRFLPDAINAVNMAAPVALLEGVDKKSLIDGTKTDISEEGVLSFTMAEAQRFYRLVAFQASDSPIVVTSVIAEATPEGRKQLNKYIRGTWDRPRLVLKQGVNAPPSFLYYTMTSESIGDWDDEQVAFDPIGQFVCVDEVFYNESSPATPYNVSSLLRRNIIDSLTAMVLEAFSDQRAASFAEKANSY